MQPAKKRILQSRVDLLNFVKSIPRKKRACLINMLDADSIHSICECLHNLFKNNIDLSEKKCLSIRKRFEPHKKEIKDLINAQSTLKRRKNILKNDQIGNGLFTVLASVVLPAIISAIASK